MATKLIILTSTFDELNQESSIIKAGKKSSSGSFPSTEKATLAILV